MAKVITDATLEYIEALAELELSGEEKEAAKRDMGRMLDYVEKMNELDTTGIEPMSHVFPLQNVFREDKVQREGGSVATLRNAPCHKEGMFVVPRTF